MRRFLLLPLQVLLTILLSTAGPATASTAPAASFEAGSVHVDQYGTGSPALVLIPGLTDSGAVWDATVARYQSAHTIYVLTLPGFGGRASISAPMLDTVTRDIAAFLPRANKPVLIGHSMGGFLAIRLAEEHSNLIAGAIAVDGLPVFPGMDTLTHEQRTSIAATGATRIRSATPAAFDASEHAQIGYMTKPANVAAAESFSKGANQDATATYMQEMLAADLRPQLSQITVPLLEIAPFDASVDAQNPYHPLTSSAEKKAYYASLFAGDAAATVVTIDDSRHFVMLDQPAAFYATIDAFLAKLS